ncbi:hypothetical protein BAY1663_04529 [Pseudomonas sp. BAY1663]|nr:hypothetical protein BAY1663_04529 [Pseudomonas sp. BAY1663]
MWPERWRRMCGSTARVTLSTPNTLVANSRSVSLALVSSTAPSTPKPALLISTSMRPNCLMPAATA